MYDSDFAAGIRITEATFSMSCHSAP